MGETWKRTRSMSDDLPYLSYWWFTLKGCQQYSYTSLNEAQVADAEMNQLIRFTMLFMRGFFSTKKHAPSTIEQILQFHRKGFDGSAVKSIHNFVIQNKIGKIPLWRMSSFMRFFSNFAKLQVYAYGILSIGFLVYSIQTKWQTSEDIRRRIKIAAPFIVVSTLAALRLSTHMTKILAKEINYYPATKQFGLSFYSNFFTTVEHKIPTTDVKPLKIKTRFQSVNYEAIINDKPRQFTTQVLSQWYNKRLFYHFMEGKDLSQDPSEAVQMMFPPKNKKI